MLVSDQLRIGKVGGDEIVYLVKNKLANHGRHYGDGTGEFSRQLQMRRSWPMMGEELEESMGIKFALCRRLKKIGNCKKSGVVDRPVQRVLAGDMSHLVAIARIELRLMRSAHAAAPSSQRLEETKNSM